MMFPTGTREDLRRIATPEVSSAVQNPEARQRNRAISPSDTSPRVVQM